MDDSRLFLDALASGERISKSIFTALPGNRGISEHCKTVLSDKSTAPPEKTGSKRMNPPSDALSEVQSSNENNGKRAALGQAFSQQENRKGSLAGGGSVTAIQPSLVLSP